MRDRLTRYERKYRLEDAVREIHELNQRVALRDEHIEKLNDELTARDKHVKILVDENQALRLKAGISPDEVVDLRELRVAQYIELETLRAGNRCCRNKTLCWRISGACRRRWLST